MKEVDFDSNAYKFIFFAYETNFQRKLVHLPCKFWKF